MPVALDMPEPRPPDPGRIVDLVSSHTDLSPNGEGRLRGICPFCGSRAFVVRPPYGTFHCFRCGEGGDARAFAARISAR